MNNRINMWTNIIRIHIRCICTKSIFINQSLFGNVNSTWVPIFIDTPCDLNTGTEGCGKSGIYYQNRDTGELRQPLPYSDSGYPMCHDLLYNAGVLGDTCHDEGDYDTCDPGYTDSGRGCELDPEPESEPDINTDGCINVEGYLLSKGSYLAPKGNIKTIVGSPCNPIEFCSDKNTNDETVRDHCEDIWTDTDSTTDDSIPDPPIEGEREPMQEPPGPPIDIINPEQNAENDSNNSNDSFLSSSKHFD